MKQQKIRSFISDQMSLLETSFFEHGREVENFVTQVVDIFNQGGRLLVIGSGSMGAVANLIANLFLHRLSLERPPLPALSLGHDMTLSTSLMQTGQSRLYFSRTLRAMATPNDVVLILADSQRDEALADALTMARQLGCKTALLVQQKADMATETVDFKFVLNTASRPRAVEGALFFGHLLCELVEGELFGI